MTSYTLNLNYDDPTVIPTTVPVIPTTMPATSLTTPPATVSPSPVPTTTRAAAHPLTALVAVIGITWLLLCGKPHS